MSATETINFTRGVPAVESYPTGELADAAAAAIPQQKEQMLIYTASTGHALLRGWRAQWQKVAPENVLIGNGSLELFEFLTLALLQPGDVVFTEAPSYDRAITLIRRRGAVPV